jgi:hypothetical protein
MSVMLLSHAIKEGLAPDLPSVDESHLHDNQEVPKNESFSSDRFTKIFEDASQGLIDDDDQLVENKRAAEGKSRDDFLMEQIEKHERIQEQKEQFERSLPTRDALRSKWPEGTIPQTVKAVLAAITGARKDPVRGGRAILEALAQDQFRLNLGRERAVKRPSRDEIEVDPMTGRPFAGKLMDYHIENAVALNETREADALDEKTWRMIDGLLPGLGRDAQLKIINDWTDEGLADPIHGAQKIATRFGLPVTPEQQDYYNRERGVINHIQNAAATGQYNPQRDPEIIKILADPQFPRTGNPETDFARAIATDGLLQQNEQRLTQGIDEFVEQCGGWETPFARELTKLIDDKAFMAIVERNNAVRGQFDLHAPFDNLRLAVAQAQMNVERNKQALAKARRVGHVRSSTGSNVEQAAASAPRGLSWHLGKALENYGE